ncbi:MAG TPA: tol-pal system protein YbgF [Alphaproteobacteria bacterium]|nr:tol-pal system protein YbgF [Alphaproteobacteria bacterium]
MRFHNLLGGSILAAALMLGTAAPTVAQSREEAQLAVRIQQLEEQIRLLTGQVEGLQFQLTQMQTLIEKQTQDNEFRFQQLEGAAGTAPAPQQQGAVTDTFPEDPTTTAALPAEPMDALGAPTQEPGAAMHEPGVPMDDIGDSADPLVGSNSMGVGVLGANNPLDLSLDGGAQISNGDAQAQYQAGYDAIVRGDYAFAEDQFQQFIQLYPDDPNAADATNWLGEALMQRGAYDDAALVLAEGYQKYQDSPRAPDLMLKLGIALAGAGETEVACRTFFTLQKRYPNLAPAFVQRLNDEKSKAQCPV